jgi:hypothetical protein
VARHVNRPPAPPAPDQSDGHERPRPAGWHVRATRVAHNDPMDSVAVPERLMTSVRALGPTGSRWLEDLPGILASLAADWSIAYGRPLGGGNAAYVIEAVTASGRPVIAKLALPAGVDGFCSLRAGAGDPPAGRR